jgi:predicted anti-sigma-YlaC factor YlaD
VNDCDRLRYDIGAYVLGALDATDSERVRRHLHQCPECVAELDQLAPLPELLTIAGGAKAAQEDPLPAAFEERLLDAYARDRAADPPRRVRRRRLPRLRRRLRVQWMAAGAAAALAAAALAIVFVGGEEEAPGYDVSFRNTAYAPGARGSATLESAGEGTELHLYVRNLPRDPSVIYEVICEAPTWKASAGTFRVGRDGRAYVVLNTAARRGEYDAIRVVRRGRDGARDVLQARLS